MWRLLVIALLAAQAQAQGPRSYIVGGQEARPPGKYPWQGSLQVVPLLGSPWHNCGCVYIGGKYALTAAHCVDNTNPDRLRVVLGAHDLETELEGKPEYFNVTSATQNPDWSNTPALGFPNDVAVLELDKVPSEDNVFIQAIAVPDPDRNEEDWVDQNCMITGWGRLTGGGDLPNMLQEADIDVLLQPDCQTRWSPYPIGAYHVCVMDLQYEQKGSCNGDSGGPLMCRENASEDYELVGLTSWGVSGCGTNYPSVYAKVSYFSDWIANVTATEDWSMY